MAGRTPEEKVSTPLMHQRWDSLTFLHWAYEPDAVQRLLPDGLEVDVVEGSAWVSVTPFLITLRPPGLPAIPGVSTFGESNVRTYVRDRSGTDALWFFTLDAGRLAAVAALRGIGLPYRWARMTVERDGDRVRYTSRRRERPPARLDLTIRVGSPLDEADRTERTDLLTGRWRAFARIGGKLFTVPVQHQEWPLCNASVESLEADVLEAAGLAAPDHEPSVQFSPGVDVRIGPPRTAG